MIGLVVFVIITTIGIAYTGALYVSHMPSFLVFTNSTAAILTIFPSIRQPLMTTPKTNTTSARF